MTKEEIKEELLKNEQQQINIIINAQFISLYIQLIKKGIFIRKDIEEMEQSTKEHIDKLNDKITDEIYKKIEEEE